MATKSINQKERREQERVPLRFPVVVRVSDRGPTRGQSVNLSASGILIALPCEVPLGQELELTIELPDGLPALEVRALALRINAVGKSGPPFRLGLHFIHQSRETLQRIRSLIYEH